MRFRAPAGFTHIAFCLVVALAAITLSSPGGVGAQQATPSKTAGGASPDIGGADSTPPVVTITPGSETVVAPTTVSVTITWCDNVSLRSHFVYLNSANVTANFTYVTSSHLGCGAYATSTGTVTLASGANTLEGVAFDNAFNEGTQTVTYTYAHYLSVSTAATNDDNQNMALCAASCFAATYHQGTVPYFSMDTPRSVTVAYQGDRLAARPFIFADAALASGAFTLQKYALQAKVNWGGGYVNVTFLNGDQTLYFSPPASQTTYVRLAGQFDASSYATKPYPLQLIVSAYYTNGQVETWVDSSQVLLIDNERHSPIARGWTLGGVARISPLSTTGAVITEGDGSAEYYKYPPSCPNGFCTYISPAGDYSLLTYNPYTARYQRAFPDSTKQVFDVNGELLSVTDRVGNAIQFTYDSAGRVQHITDPIRVYNGSPTWTCVTYQSVWGIAKIQEPAANGAPCQGRATTYSIGSDSTLQTIQDPDGKSTRFGYDASSRLSTIIDRRGDTTRFTYRSDNSWKLASVTGPRVPVDAGNGTTTMQAPMVLDSAWQPLGVPTSSTSGTPAVPLATALVVASVTDPAGHRTRFSVDHWGEPVTTWDALGDSLTITRSGMLPIKIPSLMGGVDSIRYNSAGLPVALYPAGRDSTVLAYGSGFATPDSIWGPHQISERMVLDSVGNIASIKYAGQPSSIEYDFHDHHGRDTVIFDPLSHIMRIHYDAGTGNADSTLLPGNQWRKRRFDAYGRDSVVWGNGQAQTTVLYDLMNRPIRTYTSAQADTVLYTYDALFLVRVRDAKGQVFRRSVDALGRVDTLFDPADTLHRFVTRRYNVDGLLTSVTNRRSQRFAVTYDAVHRPLTRTGTKSTVDSLGYSANWRVMAAWNAISRDSMFFSSAGWLDSVKTRFAGGQWFRTTYRPTSNQQLDSVAIASSSGITFPSPKFVYDPTSTALLKAIAGSDTASFTYDAEFKQISKTLGSALTRTDSFTTLHQIYESTYSLPSADSAFWRAYLSDSLGRLVGVARNDPYGVLIGGEIYRFAITQLTIGYDSLGRLSAQDFGYANSCGSVNPDYGLSCPPSAGSENSYSYDRADNLIGHHLTWPQGNQFDSTTYTVGNRIQTQWTPGLSYVHDLDGNITRKYGASTDIRYAWSASGQLMGDTVASTGATIGYDYNALGQLVRRTKNGAADRYYLWDGMQPVAELDGSASNRIAEYAYLPGGGEQPFAIVLGAKAVSAIRDVELDAMGNAIGVLNSAGGVIERRTYDLWGAISSDSGALGDSAFVGWKGLLWQGDSTRLYYAQNRWYDPNTGRFVSEDPIGIAGGLNAYVFAGDDPVNGSDPSGLHGFCGALMGPCMGGHSVGIDPSGCRGNALCAERGGKFLPGGYLGTLPVYGTVADLGTTATAATGVFDASAAFSGLASAADLAPPLALAEGIIAIGYVAVMPAFPGNGTLRTRAISGALVGNDATVVYSRSEAKQIRDAIRSVTGAPATTSQFNCMADFIHECKDAGDGGSKNDKGDFTWTELLQIARDLFSPEY